MIGRIVLALLTLVFMDCRIELFSAPAGVGEFGGNLELLSRYCSGPKTKAESNFFIDMWAEQNMASLLRLHGFTNNHALFINSHGRSGPGERGVRFVLYPHASVCRD